MTLTTDPIDKLLLRLHGVEASANGWMAFCPLHEADAEAGGHQRSLSISRGDDGRALIKCFADCPTPQILYSVGMRMGELFPRDDRRGGKTGKRKQPRGRKVAEYDYRDVDGVILFQAVRFEDPATGEKTFTQRRPNGEGGWIYNLRGVTRVPYRLPELAGADRRQSTVYICEGEKKVEALRAWGFVATCNVGGAGKWHRSYSQRLKGFAVVILPDNDEPGLKHALQVLESLKGIAASAKIVHLPGLSPKGDVCDWIEAGGTKETFLQIVENATGEALPPTVDQVTETGQAPGIDPLSLILPDALNDIANGRRLIRKHGVDMRFCHPWDKWLVWDGKRWKIDDTASVERRALEVSDELWKQARDEARSLSDGEFRRAMSHARYSAGMPAIKKMLVAAACQPGHQVLPTDLDSQPLLLNCQNGTVDLRNGQVHPHRREDLVTKISPVAFDPAAVCPTWERFVLSLFGGNAAIAAYIQRVAGYWATGIVREQILPILYGSGANGKTTFINSIMDVLGPDFAIKGAQDFLMARKSEIHPTEKADLFGRRLVVCTETQEGRRLAESLVKELTGTETIRARRMREDFWEFKPTHKLCLCTNHKPVVSGTDVGIWRRMRLIPFGVKFWDAEAGEVGPDDLRQDKGLPERLREEYPGILAWLVRGCIDWLQFGEQLPPDVKEETSGYRESQDVIGSWMQECCVTAHAFSVQATELYLSYKAWCELNGEWSVSQRRFGASMTERGFTRLRNDGIWYRGLTLVGKLNNAQERTDSGFT